MAESEETDDDMISITSDWKGTVFGDVGGQSNITELSSVKAHGFNRGMRAYIEINV